MSQLDTKPPGVAVCGVDFGWGSAGKLAAILRVLRQQGDMRVVMFGTELGRSVLSGAEVDAWYPEWPEDDEALRRLMQDNNVVVGLVVLDPQAAIRFEAVYVRTVYVDSIPYLWTGADPLPCDVSAYCAQRSEIMPAEAAQALAKVSNLQWIEAVVAAPETGRLLDSDLAVLNFGGLHSPTHQIGNTVYHTLVVRPSLDALALAGYRRVEICGNVRPADLAALLADTPLDVGVGPRSHEEFMTLMASADLLVTSPGLTTLIEASSSGCPTVCLPPQNLSQIFNADRFADAIGEECRVTWPTTVLDISRLNEVRPAGEEAALQLIDTSLASVEPAGLNELLTERLLNAIGAAHAPRNWSGLATVTGNRGASQVASVLRDLAEGRFDQAKEEVAI